MTGNDLTRPDWGDGEYTSFADEPPAPFVPQASDAKSVLPSRIASLTEADVRHIMRNDVDGYWQSPELQARHLELIQERLGEKPAPDAHIPVAALRTVTEARRGIEAVGDWPAFEASFDGLPEPVLSAVAGELAEPTTWAPTATLEDVKLLAPQVDLSRFSNQQINRIYARTWRIFDRLWNDGRESEFDRLLAWFSRVPPLEAHAVLQALAR